MEYIGPYDARLRIGSAAKRVEPPHSKTSSPKGTLKLLRGGGFGAQEGFGAGYICGNIHFDTFAGGGFSDGDAVAVFHPAKLLELLDALEFTRRKRGKIKERVSAKSVEADVLEKARDHVLAGIAHPGNRRAGKIKRAVVEIDDDFDDVGIHDVFAGRNGDAER